ncbi:UNVERIFIED_CONTAM: hypothetical protein Slati_4513600 [Sesamum latifolium]|uniref:Reverse transcriptase RNase H-like domain-containing protein n=1 Tax=Sesamum latifolium TaxID=2727402 RepID=A0AAW2SST6_9LAMI
MFVWLASDFQGINPEVIEHQLNVDPNAKPIRQKRRNFGPKRNLIIEIEVVSSALIELLDHDQRPVYYVSRMLQGAENNYLLIEKYALALIVTTRKLRLYFQSRAIIMLTNQPLKQVLTKPEASGRLVKWTIKLGEFYIKFHPRTVIKAQVQADFLVEMNSQDGEREQGKLFLQVDGSSNSTQGEQG